MVGVCGDKRVRHVVFLHVDVQSLRALQLVHLVLQLHLQRLDVLPQLALSARHLAQLAHRVCLMHLNARQHVAALQVDQRELQRCHLHGRSVRLQLQGGTVHGGWESGCRCAGRERALVVLHAACMSLLATLKGSGRGWGLVCGTNSGSAVFFKH